MPFANYVEALGWFQMNNGKEVPGPKDDDTETFTLTVGGTTSSIYRYYRLDVSAYCKAFTDACNELRDGLSEASPP